MSTLRLGHDIVHPAERLQALNRVADEIRPMFNAVIGALSLGYGHDIDWWVSEIASRNTNTSSLFADCCQLVFAKRALERDPEMTDIVFDSPVLGRVMQRYCRRRSLSVRVTWTSSDRAVVFEGLNRTLKHLRGLAQLIFQWMVCRMMGRPSRMDYPPDLTLLDTFVLEESFQGEVFHDRYYTGIENFLTDTEKHTVYFLPTLCVPFRRVVGAVRSVRRSRQRILLREDFVKAIDYVFAFLYPFRALKLFPKTQLLEGLDITPLLRTVWAMHLFSSGSILGLLYFRFAHRLKQSGVSVRLVVDWFENQIIDKGGNAGFRRFYPETPLIGYQGFIVPKNFLCMYPTKEEAHSSILPHSVAVCGRGFVAERKEFCEELDVVPGPAFRFSEVRAERSHWPEVGRLIVLVVFPLEEEWVDVYRMALAFSEESFPSYTQFWLKPHPASSAQKHKMRECAISLSSRFKIVEGEFAVLVEQVHVVMGTMSSACLESVAKGVPVIVVGSQSGLTQNPIPHDVDPALWRLCYTSGDVADALRDFANLLPVLGNSLPEGAQKVQDDYFEPVTRETVARFLRLSLP